jgi:hypothetical protein
MQRTFRRVLTETEEHISNLQYAEDIQKSTDRDRRTLSADVDDITERG